LWLPPLIRKRLQGKTYFENTIGMSEAKVLMFSNMVLKIQPDVPWADREATMLEWLEGRVPAPSLIEYEKYDGMSYLLMTRIHGRMACEDILLNQPKLLINRLAEALHTLWVVDISSCPVIRNIDTELAEAKYRIENGMIDMDQVEPETFGTGGFQSPKELLLWLEKNRPSFDPVLSHGDFCLPNVFFTETGLGGFIDLGDSGIGDRWRDIALCHRSLRHNVDGTYGERKQNVNPDTLFEALGITPDKDKLRWYLLLDELF